MPALAQHVAAKGRADFPGCLFHLGGAGDGVAAQDFRLRDVGGDDLRQRQKLGFQRRHRVGVQKPRTGGSHHHRIHHNVLCAVAAQLFGNDMDELGGADHADLHRVWENVGEHRVELLPQKDGGRVENVGHAGGVLGSQGGDGAHGKYTVHRHGLDVCLNPGASAGIAPSDRQCCSHKISSFFSIEVLCGKRCGSPGGARWCPQCAAV